MIIRAARNFVVLLLLKKNLTKLGNKADWYLIKLSLTGEIIFYLGMDEYSLEEGVELGRIRLLSLRKDFFKEVKPLYREWYIEHKQTY